MNRLVGTQNSPSCLFNSIFKHEKPKAYRNERVAPTRRSPWSTYFQLIFWQLESQIGRDLSFSLLAK